MKLRQAVKILRAQGHAINYRERADGSIVVTRVDGVSYRNKTGNAKVRQLAGITMTEAQAKQLAYIRTPKGTYGRARKKPKLDKEVSDALKRAQRLFRTHNVQKWGGSKEAKPVKRNVEWNLKNVGKEETLRLLNQASRYAKGIAYSGAIQAFADFLGQDAWKLSEPLKNEVRKITDFLEAHLNDERITERALSRAVEILGSNAFQGLSEAELQTKISQIQQVWGL